MPNETFIRHMEMCRKDRAVNLNDLAVKIAESEGLKVQLPIGQIKEVMRIVFQMLSEMSPAEVNEILNRYRSHKGGELV